MHRKVTVACRSNYRHLIVPLARRGGGRDTPLDRVGELHGLIVAAFYRPHFRRHISWNTPCVNAYTPCGNGVEHDQFRYLEGDFDDDDVFFLSLVYFCRRCCVKGRGDAACARSIDRSIGWQLGHVLDGQTRCYVCFVVYPGVHGVESGESAAGGSPKTVESLGAARSRASGREPRAEQVSNFLRGITVCQAATTPFLVSLVLETTVVLYLDL